MFAGAGQVADHHGLRIVERLHFQQRRRAARVVLRAGLPQHQSFAPEPFHAPQLFAQVIDAATYLVGSLELVGGLALVVGLLVRPFALALAGNMIGAISTAGRIDGGPVHLLLAPALLLGMVFLLWAGAGSPALDRRLARRCTDP